ncbi:HEAT repeat domain-containing protein [Streptomyces sp. NPDC048340]|uniref:HEAT repeat domain-containing protein n=1 Tax=Streptomyces sp. NPDC048340 TaxID=3365537 RepID=UPI0037202010
MLGMPHKGAARLRIEGDVEALARLVLHPDGTPAAQAAALLADIGGRPASDALLRCAQRHEELCRIESYEDERLWPLLEAVRGLGRLREDRAVPLLLRLLEGGTRIPSYLTYRLEITVIRALIDIGAPRGTGLVLARLAENPESADIALVGELKGPEARAAVVPVLASLWNLLPGHGVPAVRVLGGFRDARTAPALLYLAGSTGSSPELRRGALEALIELPEVPWDTPRRVRNATDALWRLVRHPDRETARLAAEVQARTADGRTSLIGHIRHVRSGHDAPVGESSPFETACIAACTVVRDKPGPFRGADLQPVLRRVLLAGATPRSVRQLAAEALGALGGEAAAEALLDALGDDRIADAVAAAFTRLPRPPVRQLLELLTDAAADGAVAGAGRSRGAAVALGLLRCAEAGPLLLDRLDPEGPRRLRAAAADALGLIGHRPAAGPLGALVTDRAEASSLQARAVRAVGLIGAPESLSVLLAAAGSPSEAVRMRAAEALGGFSTAEAVGRLGALAREEGADIARAALRSLGRIGTPAVPILSELIGYAPEWPAPMQRTLVEALAQCPGSETTAALGRLVDGPFGEEVRVGAVQALGNGRDPRSVAPLIRFLDDPRTQYFYRGLAVRALARLDDEAAVQRVVAYFEDQRSYTAGSYRHQAREALGLIAARRGGHTRP